MKRRNYIIRILQLMLACAFIIGSASILIHLVLAIYMPGDQLSAINQTLEEDIIFSGSFVSINAPIKGDIKGIGNSITILEPVKGEVMVAASSITINAPIKGSVMIAAQHIIINDAIDGPLTLYGNSVDIFESSTIKGKLTIFANKVTINGRVVGDADIGATQVLISGTIEGNADIEASNIDFSPLGLVTKDLFYRSDYINIDQDQVGGELIDKGPEKKEGFKLLNWLLWFGFKYLSFLLVGFVLINLPWMHVGRKARLIKKRPKIVFLTGILGSIAIPIILILLLISIIGIPLAILLLGILVMVIYISKIFLSVFIGQELINKSIYLQFALGWLILLIIMQLPYIGWIFSAIAWVSGIGVSLIYFLAKLKDTVTHK